MGSFCVLLILFAGCSDSQSYVKVSGRVHYNGSPVQSGVVMFQPAAGEIARGEIQSDGSYTLETLGKSPGVVPGKCKVRVSVRDQSKDEPGEIGLGKLLIPSRYIDFDLSGLTFDVTMDRNESYDIYLTDGG